MRLTDLSPEWLAADGRRGQGVTFDCPGKCCAGLPSFKDWEPGAGEHRKRAGVVFANPIDGGAPIDGPTWTRTGDTFETLTLSPSVFINPPDHWHGFITNGEAVTC